MKIKIFLSVVILLMLSFMCTVVNAQNTSGAVRDAINQIKKGDRALDAGNIEEAKSRYKKAASLDNSLASAWIKLSSIYYAEGKFKDVVSFVDKGLEKNSNSAQLKLWKGLAFHMLGKVKEGTKLLEEAVKSKSDLAFAYYEPSNKIGLAKYYLKTGAWKKAKAAYSAYLKHRASILKKEYDYKVYFRIGETSLHLKDPGKALNACDKSLKLKTGYPSALWCKAESLRQLGRYTEALPYFNRIKRYGGKKPQIFSGLSVSLFYSGNGIAAVTYAKRYLGLRPSDPAGHVLLGDLLYATGKQVDSLRSYKRAMKLNPENIHIPIKLGVALIHLKQYMNAINVLYKASKKWKNNTEIYIPLAYAYIQDNKAQKAFELLGTIQTEKYSPQLLTIYGNAAAKSDHLEKARTLLLKAMKARPKHLLTKSYYIDSLMKLGYKNVTSGKLIESVKNLEEGLEMEPQNTKLIRNLALVKIMIGKFKESEKLLLRGLKLSPKDFFFTRLLGRVYLEEKNTKKAIEYLELAKTKATKRSSDVLARVQLDLGIAYTMKPDMEKAVTLIQEAYSNALNIPKLAKLIERNLVRGLISRAAERLSAGKGKKALEDLKAVDEYNTKDLAPEAIKQLKFIKAMAYVELGKYRESSRYIAKIGKTSEMAKLFKKSYEKFGPKLLKAYLAYRQMNLGKARTNFRAIMKQLPPKLKSQIYTFLKSCDEIEGSTYLKKGKAKLAIAMFKRIPKGAMSPQVKMNLALALYNKGSVSTAINMWKAIGTPKAMCNLGAHYHNKGDPANSYKYLKACMSAGLGGKTVRRLVRIKSKIFGYK